MASRGDVIGEEGGRCRKERDERRLEASYFSSFLVRISREDEDDDSPQTKSTIAVLLYFSLEGGLSTFLCPAEIQSVRKCLLKILSLSSLSLFLFRSFVDFLLFLTIPLQIIFSLLNLRFSAIVPI